MSNAAVAANTANSPESPQDAPKKGTGKLLYVLVGVNSLLVAGVLAVTLLRPAAPAHPVAAAAPAGQAAAGHGTADPAAPAAPGEAAQDAQRPAAAPTAPSPTLPLGEFIVRLPSAEGDRYARFAFEVSLGTQQQADVLKLQLPEIRDRFIGILTDLSVDAVRGKAELDELKKRLLKEVREVMPGGAVRSLFLTEYVLQ